MNNFIQGGILFTVALGIIILVYFFNYYENTAIDGSGLDDPILPENVTRDLIESGKAISDLPFTTP